MRRAILCAVATALLSSPGAAAADPPPPAAEPPPVTAAPPAITPPPAPPAAAAPQAPAHTPPLADPLNDLGGGAIVGGTFALVILLVCGVGGLPAGPKAQCAEASGFTALGLLGAGIPVVLLARQRSFGIAGVPFVDGVTFTAGARRGAVGLAWTF